MAIDDINVYVDGGKAVPIRAGSLKYTTYVGRKMSTPVVFAGARGNVSSRTKDDDIQTVSFEVPIRYDTADVLSFMRNVFDVEQGIDLTLRNDQGYRQDYVNMSITDSGEVEDNGEPFIEFTLSGTNKV
jgi:hypothetical protein